MKKKALVITYHVKDSNRIGGFHRFINFLELAGYDVDWLCSPVSITWILNRNDRESISNLLKLSKGMNFQENGAEINYFAVPILIPARIACLFKMKLGNHYWPKWKKIRKKLKNHYDIILVEGVGCQYADDLRRDYPGTRLIYRPSDILETFLKTEDALSIEKNMINKSDISLCVDELQLRYYEEKKCNMSKIQILRNPITTKQDLIEMTKLTPQNFKEKKVVYVGVSFVDIDIIEYAATLLPQVKFIIIGPFAKKSHDNIIYTGALKKDECNYYLASASVGINPIKNNDKNQNLIQYGYTRKIISYMTYLLPIVTMNCTNYLGLPGFYDADSKEDFVKKILIALNVSKEERLSYKDDYIQALRLFSDELCYLKFLEYLKEKNED